MKLSTVRNPREIQVFRRNVKSLLKQRGWSSAELASRAFLPLTSLTRATDGTVQNPGIDLVISAAKGLGTSVGALLGDVEEPLQGHNKLIFEMVDAVGLASAITGVFSRHSVNITKIESETFTVTDLVGQGRDIARFRVEWTSASLTQLLEVLEDLRQHGPFTKAVLISSLDISGSDVLELIAELLQASRNDSRVYGSYLPSSMH